MKLKKKKYLIVLILILILFFSIGFALLSSNLSINGLGIFKPNTWDIHFANIVDDGSEAELTVPAKIEDDGLNINFDVDLNNLGDNYYFYVDIVNDGTIDAMIDTWKLNGITENVEKFINASVTYADGVELNNYDLLPKKKTDKLKVTVEYSDEFVESTNDLPQMDGSITLTLNINYIQADERAAERQKRADTDSPVVRVKQNEKSVQGNNRWYKTLTLNTKLIDPSGISSAKYCATTSDSCTPDNPVVLKNNTFDIRLDNSTTPWTICIETVDNEENTENYCDKNKYYVDGEEPTINNVTATSLDDTISITVEASDQYSGINKYYYSKDGGRSYISSKDNNYTFAELEPNDYIVMSYVEDNAGNTSSTNTATSTVRIRSWCEKNEITTLSDCAIATAANNPDVEVAKAEIKAKPQPDFSKTSPTFTYKEKHSSDISTLSITGSTYKFATEYTFNKEDGQYTLVNSKTLDISNLDYDNIVYYSCLNLYSSTCTTLYKIYSVDKSTSASSTNVQKYDYTSDVESYDEKGIGMYAAEDEENTTSYYYRGSVGGNFVKFADMYWRIIRINGDGSTRLMYFSDTDTNKGKNAFNSSINNNNWDPTYVGLMYNDTNFSDIERLSDEATFGNFKENSIFYFGKGYTWDSSAKKFKLSGTVESGDIISGLWKEKYDEIMSDDYVYTCFETSATSTCPVMMKITGYSNVYAAKVQYISHSSTSYDNATTNITPSRILTELNNWYKTNLVGKSDKDNNLYTDYIVNQVICNDRSLSQGTTGNGFDFSPRSHYGPHYRLYNHKSPSYQCPNIKRDGFTLKNSSIGNETLDYSVGTITADEVAFAGGVDEQVNELYFINYNDDQSVLTVSPSLFNSMNRASYQWYINDYGGLARTFVTSIHGVRPVISLSKDVLISGGDGTADKPYTVKLK